MSSAVLLERGTPCQDPNPAGCSGSGSTSRCPTLPPHIQTPPEQRAHQFQLGTLCNLGVVYLVFHGGCLNGIPRYTPINSYFRILKHSGIP